MLAAAASDGITTVVATPHAHHVDAQAVIDGVARLNAAARDTGIAITVLSGHEARIGADLVNRFREGSLLTLNGSRWLLLECFLHDDWPIYLIERSVDRLLNAGLRPLLAHAERYSFVQRDPDALRPLIERGIPIQINAGSLVLRETDIERVTAERLLRARMAHVIASDAHNGRYRPPVLRAAHERAAQLVGETYVGWMRRIPHLVLDDQDFQLPSW